jgi:toxin YoeB
MRILFTEQGWDDYLYWQQHDRALLKRVNALLTDITRNPYEGIGKPEPLRHSYQGWWSRRINDEHRLIYRVLDDAVWVSNCRYHYR